MLSLQGQSELIFAYSNKKRFKSKENKTYNSQLLFKKILSWYGEAYRIVVEPLYYHEDQIGFAAIEIGPREGIGIIGERSFDFYQKAGRYSTNQDKRLFREGDRYRYEAYNR